MKPILLFLALIVLPPKTYSQALALNRQVAKTSLNVYTPANFRSYSGHKNGKPLIIAGCIITSTGVIVMGVGLFYVSHNFGLTDAEVASREQKGKNCAIAGGVIALAGGIVGGIGVHKVIKNRYGVELVMPKNNEIGLAYNF